MSRGQEFGSARERISYTETWRMKSIAPDGSMLLPWTLISIFYFMYLLLCLSVFVCAALGPSIKHVTLFLANFDPLPCHTLSRIPEPPSTSHISDPPFLLGLVQKTRTKTFCTKTSDKNPLYKFSLNCSWGYFKGSLVWKVLFGGFCPFPFCQNTTES